MQVKESEKSMARKKAKSKAKIIRDPLPEHFNSLEEAAEFWDTHDTAEYEEYFKEVHFDVNLKPRTVPKRQARIVVRLGSRVIHVIEIDSALYEKVSAIAKKKRLRPEALVNRWLEEKAS
jgi:hypothetical protein